MAAPIVLVVEDDPATQQIVVRWLEEEGYGVLTAAPGAVLPLARSAHPAVLVLDYLMPGVTGAELSRCLRADLATAAIPIIAMSALPDAAREAGMIADAWLAKPFDADALCMAVARCLAQAR